MTEIVALLERVQNFSIDEKGVSLPFTSRLAREQGWTHAYASRVVDEYKRFMVLAVAAGHPVSPPPDVDQAWHLHLLYTRSYWQQFCGEVLRREVHHEPTEGGGQESEKFANWYQQTCESYQRIFGEQAPEAVWPLPAKHGSSPSRWRWVDLSKFWLIPRWFF